MAGGHDKTKTQEGSQDVKKNKDKRKKGKDAAVEAITNALKALPQDQQVATLLSKYAELVEENRNLQSSCRNFERTAQQAQKDKDRVELEHSKAVLTRSRLESLCRELQRQNKIIKDENLTRLKEEEDKRKDVSSQFNTTLSEISHLMEENTQSNSKLREENQKMAVRLQDLLVQHEKREDHVEKVLKQREIETQLAEAKLAKIQIEVKEQKEKMLVERKGLLEELSVLQDKLQEKALTEISLRTQLNSYTKKFEDFQGTIDKSNQIFNGFKKEIEDMSKTIKLLEKETKTWKEKCERANIALCQMFNDRSQLEARIESQTKQNTQLQSLCRALQQQTKELRAQLRSQGIAEASTTTLPQNDLLSKDPPSREKSPSLLVSSKEEGEAQSPSGVKETGGNSTNDSSVSTENSTLSIQEPTGSIDGTIVSRQDFMVSNQDTTVSTQDTTVSTQDTTVSTQDTTVSNQDTTVSNQDTTVSNQDTTVSNQDTTVSNQDTTVSNQDTTVSNQDTTVSNHDTTVSNQDTTVSNQDSAVTTQDNTVFTLKTSVSDQNPAAFNQDSTTSTQDSTFSTQGCTVSSQDAAVTTQDPTLSINDPSILSPDALNSTNKNSIEEDQNSTDCESNGTLESELDMESVD